MGLAQEIKPRDSIETIVTATTQAVEHANKVNAFLEKMQANKYHVIRREDLEMPSVADGTVKVTHIYYREVLPR